MIKLPKGVNLNNLIDDLRTFSWEACETLLHYSQILKDSEYKSNIIKNGNNDDPVTMADLRVNEIIIKRITEKYRGVCWEILSEENAKISPHYCDNDAEWTWVLDPLDGTKDFIQGTNSYAMHLALNYKNTPYLGIVLIPEKDQLWISDGEKTWCENREGLEFKFNLVKKHSLKEMVLVTSKNHNNESLRKLIHKINFKEVVIMGSIGCKIASLLRGESDIYICLSLAGKSSPKDWDFAAPQAILKAAGGEITDLNNEPLSYDFNEKGNYNQGGIIVASNNKDNHKDLCSQIKRLIIKFDVCPI